MKLKTSSLRADWLYPVQSHSPLYWLPRNYFCLWHDIISKQPTYPQDIFIVFWKNIQWLRWCIGRNVSTAADSSDFRVIRSVGNRMSGWPESNFYGGHDFILGWIRWPSWTTSSDILLQTRNHISLGYFDSRIYSRTTQIDSSRVIQLMLLNITSPPLVILF